MIFKKNDRCKINGVQHMCIMADTDLAVLGKVEPLEEGGESVKFENCKVYSNLEEYRNLIEGLEMI